MNNVEILDKILLSDNVVENFHKEYENNYLFKNWLDELIPEVADCKVQQQQNPWHKYNVLDHILHSVDAINNQTKELLDSDRRLLAYTMFFHDIGKPQCHIRRRKNGVEIDSFFNHNIASAKTCNRVADKLEFTPEETQVLSMLVYKHDIFMNIKLFKPQNRFWKQLTPQLIEEHIHQLNTVGNGEKLMRYLVKVGRADNLAQNEKMTVESLKMLEIFDDMLDNRENKN